MKRFMVVVFLVSVCVACLGAAARDRLQFRAAGFSIQPLEVQPARSAYQALVMVSPASDGFAPNVNVQIQPYAGSIEEYATISTKQFVALKFDLIKKTRVSNNSVILEYTGQLKGRKMHWYAKATSNGKVVYLATATAKETQWGKAAARLEQCVDSLTIEKGR